MTIIEIHKVLSDWYTDWPDYRAMYAKLAQQSAPLIREWPEVIATVTSRLSGWGVRDFSDLHQYPALGLEATLPQPEGGEIHVRAFGALIVRVGYCHAFLMQGDEHNPRFVELPKLPDDPAVAAGSRVLKLVLEDFKYHVLSHVEALSPVPFPTECQPAGTASLFHCLFGPHLSP